MPETKNSKVDSLRGSINKSAKFSVGEKRYVVVHGWYSGSESPSDEGSDEDEKEIFQQEKSTTMTPEYWHVLKALKFIKIGDPNSCLLSLTTLMDYDLSNVHNLKQFFDGEHLDMLVNLLEVKHDRCVLATLRVIKKISLDLKVIRRFVDLGISPSLVRIAGQMNVECCCLACDILANMAHCRLAARNIRKSQGIPVIVSLLNMPKETLLLDYEKLNESDKMNMDMARSAAYALWHLCAFTKNKKVAAKTGVIPIMATIILTGNAKISVPMIGVLCECSSEIVFQLAIESEGLVGILLEDMTCNNKELNILCANALANAAGRQDMVSHMIRYNGGIKLIVKLLKEVQTGTRFIAALLNLVWKSSKVYENVKSYEMLNTSYYIINYVDSADLKLRIPATGAIAELAKNPACRSKIIKSNIFGSLMINLASTDTTLLTNTAKALGEIFKNTIGLQKIMNYDGMLLLWSLLKNPSNNVISEALRALRLFIRYAHDSGELVRSLDNSLQMLVKMLRNKNMEILADVCLLISEVANDEENLMVMTEHGVIHDICRLLSQEGKVIHDALRELNNFEKAKDNFVQSMKNYEALVEDSIGDKHRLRRALGQVVSACSRNQDNRLLFGVSGAIACLVLFLNCKDMKVQSQACNALKELSFTELNCVQMHLCGAVPVLLALLPDCNEATQIAISACLKNIRSCVATTERRTDMCAKIGKEEEKQGGEEEKQQGGEEEISEHRSVSERT